MINKDDFTLLYFTLQSVTLPDMKSDAATK